MSSEKVVPKKYGEKEVAKKQAADKDNKPKEIGGRDGPDPVRYGDWENNGIASDF